MAEIKAISQPHKRGKAEHSHPKDKSTVGKGEGGRMWVLENQTSSCLLVLNTEPWQEYVSPCWSNNIYCSQSSQQNSWLSKAVAEKKQTSLFCGPKNLLMSVILTDGSSQTIVSTKLDKKDYHYSCWSWGLALNHQPHMTDLHNWTPDLKWVRVPFLPISYEEYLKNLTQLSDIACKQTYY